MKYVVLSAQFTVPHQAQSACLLLRELGLPCRYQMGPRVAHGAAPCPAGPRRSLVPVRPVPVFCRPEIILNVVLPKGRSALARQLVRRFGGREIRLTAGPTEPSQHMIC